MQVVKKYFIPLLLLSIFVFAVLIPISPKYMPYAHRDSGVFLYTGWRITEGDLPYRDVWDHKPPVIFYINALGLLLTNGSRWGVWIIECISLLVTAILGYSLFTKLFDKQTAYINMILYIISLHFLLNGGNITNEYVLPLQMATLLMVLSYGKENKGKIYWVVMGVMAAIAFFTKQTAISLWLAILVYHTIDLIIKQNLKKWVTELIFFALGGGFVTASIVIYFWINGGLIDFINASFKYNYVYASLGMPLVERIKSFSVNFSSLTPSGILILGLIGIVFFIPMLKEKSVINEKYKPVFLIALISLPIEIVFISLSGRGFAHYFIGAIPLISIFSGLTLWLLFKQLSQISGSIKSKNVVAFSLSIMIIFTLYDSYKEVNGSNQSINDSSIVKYIEGITTSDDTIVIWGAEAKDYFFSKRASATKYSYLYPLYTQNYANEERVSGFLDEIIEHNPKIILDTNSSNTPFLTFPIESAEIGTRITWIQNNYYELEPLGDWTVYKRNPE